MPTGQTNGQTDGRQTVTLRFRYTRPRGVQRNKCVYLSTFTYCVKMQFPTDLANSSSRLHK